jgi:hypothetical protein
MLVAVFAGDFRQRRGFTRAVGVVLDRVLFSVREIPVCVSVGEVPVLTADFVRNHRVMQGSAELTASDCPRQ